MKKDRLLLVISSILLLLSGCSNTKAERETTEDFSKKYVEEIKMSAKAVTDEQLQNDEIPFHTIIYLEGIISKSDQKSQVLEKGDRFLLQTEKSSYMIFNDQDRPLRVGEAIRVYGEYQGFLKGILIEKEKTIG